MAARSPRTNPGPSPRVHAIVRRARDAADSPTSGSTRIPRPQRGAADRSARSCRSWWEEGSRLNGRSAARFHGIELATVSEVIEETQVRFQAAMRDAFYQVLELRAFRARQQRHARAFHRSVAHLQNL